MAGSRIDEGGGEIGVDDCLEDLGVSEGGSEVGDAETVGAGYAAGPGEEEALVVLEAGELGGGLVVFGVEIALGVVVAAVVPRVAEALDRRRRGLPAALVPHPGPHRRCAEAWAKSG